jgi:hypothetical protein
MKKVRNISNRGGARQGAGRPQGISKTKLSVSIDKTLHQQVKKKSGGNISGLVETILMDYMQRIKAS